MMELYPTIRAKRRCERFARHHHNRHLRRRRLELLELVVLHASVWTIAIATTAILLRLFWSVEQ